MKELIFSVQAIFDQRSQEGCLAQYECSNYHIPAYQRGYKWGSDANGAVSILLTDLWSAFGAYKLQERKEYYLQYITVKKSQIEGNTHVKPSLEVIDGQQRLTTLSIFLSVLSALLDKENISAGKLDYAIRENFFSEHIYEKEDLLKLISKSWTELAANSDFNKQDIFYLFSATCKAHRFFKEKSQEEQTAFYLYLLKNVKLIVNSVEVHVSSETGFKNLNTNKVVLTEAELIKGLFITKLGRKHQLTPNASYQEILEVRIKLGRHWDEISRWANQPQINTFFFNGTEGMKQLLHLAALCLEDGTNQLGTASQKNDYRLFTFYHSYSDLLKAWETIRDFQATLDDWYNDDQIYNLMGFCRFAEGGDYNTLEFLKKCHLFKKKSQLENYLMIKKRSLLPSLPITELIYGQHNEEINDALLALSVFPEGRQTRFDFHDFITQSWSLEHIFPQSPEGKNAVLNEEQKKTIRDMLGDSISPEVDEVLKKDKRTPEEMEVYYKALRRHNSPLNSIGNLCLLTRSNNSSNGCSFFKEKRNNVLKFIQQGSFVPKHTFDVFSKMIPEMDIENLYVWSDTDMRTHTNYIAKTLSNQLNNA